MSLFFNDFSCVLSDKYLPLGILRTHMSYLAYLFCSTSWFLWAISIRRSFCLLVLELSVVFCFVLFATTLLKCDLKHGYCAIITCPRITHFHIFSFNRLHSRVKWRCCYRFTVEQPGSGACVSPCRFSPLTSRRPAHHSSPCSSTQTRKMLFRLISWWSQPAMFKMNLVSLIFFWYIFWIWNSQSCPSRHYLIISLILAPLDQHIVWIQWKPIIKHNVLPGILLWFSSILKVR